jgi:hypothetical protein
LGSGLQVPTKLARLQAAQPPVQAVLQQTPLAQLADWHWFGLVQAVPFVNFATHTPALQNALAAQSPSTLHLVGQAALAPSQRKLPQVGLAPVVPFETIVQAPTVPTRLQASQPPLHAALQHTPSAQKPLRQPPAPLHAPPFATCGTQAAFTQP